LTPQAFDLLSKMLVLDPTKRITIEEALNHLFFSNVGDLKGSNYVNLMRQIEKEENSKWLKKRKN
jgi:serine/threonine protein kinase